MFSPQHILHQEQGSALATVLVISVIIMLFIGAIFSGIILQGRFIQRGVDNTKAWYAAEEGVFRYLNLEAETPTYTSKALVSLSSGNTASITAIPFGGFWDIQSQVFISNQTKKVRMLIGDESIGLTDAAIALGDSTSSLTVTGTTNVFGKVYSTNQTIREEDFKGVPFRGVMDAPTSSLKEEGGMPEFNTGLFELQEEYFESLFTNTRLRGFDSSFTGINPQVITQDTLFLEGDIVWESNQEISLKRELMVIVKGNLTINGPYTFAPYSKFIVEDTLLVGGVTKGTHLLFYAGTSLQIGGSTRSAAQVLSKGEVTIRDQAYLLYPSMVYSSKEFSNAGKAEVIDIRDQSVVDGMLLYPYQPNPFNREQLQVRIGQQATVRGGLYTRGQTELLGTVYGSVFTDQFYFYESPTSYINWLKDVTIDVTERPDDFVLPIGFSDTTRYSILDWNVVE
ncbi:MAG: hypothetical protein ED557_12145 [Balneola sp.]|nr:MAG: hypothetical protein ED557_12145 [Balneola sp.]